MRRFLSIALLALVVAGGLAADEISPLTEARNLLLNDSNDKDTLVLPTAWYYTQWYSDMGQMSEGTLRWVFSGDGSGSIDSLLFAFQWCFQENWNGTAPDTTYVTVLDTFYTATVNDSVGWYPLCNYSHLGANTGWPVVHAGWFRAAVYNFDADTADLHRFDADLAGSQ
jgi:hypothetical protein